MRCTSLHRQSMSFVVNIMHGSGQSNKMCSQLQPKKTKAKLY